MAGAPKSFNWSARQIRFIQAIHDYGRVWAIGAKRSGKSSALVEAARQVAFEWEPGVSGILAAPTYGQLDRNLLVPWRELVPADRYEHVKDPKNPRLECDAGDGMISTVYLATGKNPSTIEGVTVGWACFTELQQGELFWRTVEARVSDKKAKRLRWFGDGLPEEGWLSKELAGEDGELTRQSPYKRFIFTTWDNAANLHAGYIEKMMETLTPREVDMYLKGEFVGAIDAIYPYFRRKLHAASRVEYVPGHRVYIGLDFNSRQQSAVLCQFIGGVLRAFDEVMEPGTVIDQTVRLAQMCLEYKLNYKSPKQVVLCPDASGRTASHQKGDSSFAILEKAGFTILADSDNPDVDDRDTSVNVLMRNGRGENHFLIDPVRCKRTIESLSGLRKSQRYNQDEELTDAVDAVGYVAWRVAPQRRPWRRAPRQMLNPQLLSPPRATR